MSAAQKVAAGGSVTQTDRGSAICTPDTVSLDNVAGLSIQLFKDIYYFSNGGTHV